MPGPLLRPFDTVSPDVSECSRIPASRRPLSSAATPCAPSWAIVTRWRVRRQASGTSTSARATAAAASTSPADGTGAAVVTWSHTSATTLLSRAHPTSVSDRAERVPDPPHPDLDRKPPQ